MKQKCWNICWSSPQIELWSSFICNCLKIFVAVSEEFYFWAKTNSFKVILLLIVISKIILTKTERSWHRPSHLKHCKTKRKSVCWIENCWCSIVVLSKKLVALCIALLIKVWSIVRFNWLEETKIWKLSTILHIKGFKITSR